MHPKRPPSPSEPSSPNRFLASLTPATFDLLRPHLRPLEMARDDILVSAGDAIGRVHFPHSGIISLVVTLAEGETIEVAMIGREGALGTCAALADGPSLTRAVVRMPGSASTIDVEFLRAAAARDASLRETLARHEQALFAQAQQAAACNACHAVEARLSRCLLRLRDLSGRDTLAITQESLAQMLGVRRNSVSLVAHALQQANFIRTNRGTIEIVDLAGLVRSACECYGAVKAHCDRLLGEPQPGWGP
jgi:CRP-like cAMP-binding protein